MQAFAIPGEADKFKVAVTEASNAHDKISCEILKSPLGGLKGTEMQNSPRKGNKKTSGSCSKLKEKQESTGDEMHKNMRKPGTRKRRREGQEIQTEKSITSGEGSMDVAIETETQFSYKRRKLSAAHRGLNKDSRERKDSNNSKSTLDEKTKGDDGVRLRLLHT